MLRGARSLCWWFASVVLLGTRVAAAEAPAPEHAGSPATTRAVTDPELLEFVPAEYPAEARAKGLDATVVLVLSIDKEGKVTDVEVLEPAGHGFDEAAVAAAKRFVW